MKDTFLKTSLLVTDKCDFVPHEVYCTFIIKPSYINIYLDVALNLISLPYHCNFFYSTLNCINLIKSFMVRPGEFLRECMYILLFVGYNTAGDFC